MKKSKKIELSILMILMIIGSLALPGVMAAEDFTVNVTSTQNTALESGTCDFGNITAGTADTIPTFTLNNTGNLYATVTAAFLSDVGGVYGFTNTTYVIAGTNFSLQSNVSGTYTALGITSSGVVMTDDVPANTAEVWDARLVIPSGQQAVAYMGSVELTFS